MKNLSQIDWRTKIEETADAVILDVRTSMEQGEGIIPNAEKLNLLDGAEFINGINKLDQSKSYFVYCRSGGRSEEACLIMDSSGFTKTYNLLGGMIRWEGDVV